MKILFMGTPEFAVESLKKLHAKYEIVGIFTKVDKPNSRGKKIIFNPVKQYGIENDIPVYQPNNIKNGEGLKIVEELKPDLIVVVAYGKIIPDDIIAYPKHGIINVHSSILPKFRGAAPINAAIVAGEKETGVTIMDIVTELDAGDMIEVGKTPIYLEDNFLTLHDRLKVIGAETLMLAIEKIFKGTAVRIAQNHSEATFVKPFKKENLIINWDKSSYEINNFIRGMTPFPGVFTHLENKVLKIIEVKEYEKTYSDKINGEIVDIVKNLGFVVKTMDSSVILTKIKPENRGIISGSDSINGKQLKVGDILK
ncbi:MAG: methionyl-tRNA formyltransferase [Fusobacteriaceae bacterium]